MTTEVAPLMAGGNKGMFVGRGASVDNRGGNIAAGPRARISGVEPDRSDPRVDLLEMLERIKALIGEHEERLQEPHLARAATDALEQEARRPKPDRAKVAALLDAVSVRVGGIAALAQLVEMFRQAMMHSA
jgi:hypothetical protein